MTDYRETLVTVISYDFILVQFRHWPSFNEYDRVLPDSCLVFSGLVNFFSCYSLKLYNVVIDCLLLNMQVHKMHKLHRDLLLGLYAWDTLFNCSNFTISFWFGFSTRLMINLIDKLVSTCFVLQSNLFWKYFWLRSSLLIFSLNLLTWF